MAAPQFTIQDRDGVRELAFEIPGGITSPQEFAAATAQILPSLSGSLPVLISGRGPVWGFAMLVHAAHPTPAVATFDPRLDGYVVVASHSLQYQVGQLIPHASGTPTDGPSRP